MRGPVIAPSVEGSGTRERAGPGGPRGVSVIIPAYNEGRIIERTLDEMRAAFDQVGRDYELVVADDCSTDDTYEIVRSYAKTHPQVKVVTHAPNRGKGAAIRTGFGGTTLPIVAYIDADIHPAPETIARYLAELDNGFDIVLANKWDPTSRVEHSFVRQFASTGYGVFAKALFWIPIVDTQCGFKFFDRALLEKVMPRLTIDRFGFDIELLAWCVKDGARIAALPIDIEEIRASKVNKIEVLKMFKDLMIARLRMWMDNPRPRLK